MATTLTAEQIAAEAAMHEQARATVTPIKAVTTRHPHATIEDAYAIQQAWVEQLVQDGHSLIGHKIGLTSQAMQQQMQIDEPDFGALLSYMVINDGDSLKRADYCDPKIEVELAFVLNRPLEGERLTIVDVIAATNYVVPALELIDARSFRVDPDTKLPRTIVDTIADNAADAGIVLGGRPMRPADVDLRWAGSILHRNGVVEETGLAAGVLNHPAQGIAWLARRLAPHGQAIEAGEILLSGSFTRAVAARSGDTFTADYGPLGTVSVHFS